jgi:ankyrin repeat protein
MNSGYPETPLNCAARLGHNEIAELLVRYQHQNTEGSETDAQVLEGQTLLVGAMTENEKAVEESLKRGVEVDVCDADGGTAL